MNDTYQRPWPFFSAHLETIYPALIRSIADITYIRERLLTPDDDFLDLDWLSCGSSRLVIISHGLEGDSTRGYMRGMARAFYLNGFDALTWNFRGCSAEMNRQRRFYHSGATDDLDLVIQHAIARGYQDISLIGFSLGGNLTLKYLGERIVPDQLSKAAVFSVPLDLHHSCIKISKPSNWIYSKRFLDNLKAKVVRKSAMRSDLDITGIHKLRTLMDFDDRFTAPIHGFGTAVEYYQKCSSINFLSAITIPTLIVNASNDPFLGPTCYPDRASINNDLVIFEVPRRGGHVGFAQFNKNGLYWSEERALAFLTPQI